MELGKQAMGLVPFLSVYGSGRLSGIFISSQSYINKLNKTIGRTNFISCMDGLDGVGKGHNGLGGVRK